MKKLLNSCKVTGLQAASYLLASILTTNSLPSQAAFGYGAVWFPDGTVNWFAENTLGPLPYLTAPEVGRIRTTMDYLSERLPLSITEVTSSGQSNLMFKKSIWNGLAGPLPIGGAWTFGYWAPDGNPKDIAFFTASSVNTGTTVHEFGHALGMPHEHQREDAQGSLLICYNPGNTETDLGNVRLLSPFDVTSRMIYRNGCVTVNATGGNPPLPSYRGSTAFYSPHDINSIYRVYGQRLGEDLPHEAFGHATAVIDFDDDGFEDIVVAANESHAGTRQFNLYFYKGVQTDPSDGDSGRRYMPWFRHLIAGATGRAHDRLALAAGDFDGDGRVELAVGYPVHHQDLRVIPERRVKIYGQALPAAFTAGPGSEPWGVKGLRELQDIAPADINPNYSGIETFAAELQVGRLTNADRDDLIIGWPGASTFSLQSRSPGVVVHLAHQSAATELLDTSSAAITTNPAQPFFVRRTDFGSAITVLQGSKFGIGGLLDTLVVGAPGVNNNQGQVYIYGSAANSGWPVDPPLLSTLSGEAGSRFGQALASIYVEGSIIQNTHFSIVVGAPKEIIRVGRNSITAGAVYHYRINGLNVTQLGRLKPPPHRLEADMQWGYALAVIQDGSSYDGVRVGIGAPGAASRNGLVYAWHPFTETGNFSTSGASLTPPSTIARRYGEEIRPIATGTRFGFAISSPTGISSGETSGFVQTRINQNALTEQNWNSDRQIISQSIAGDRLPDNL